MKILQIAPPWIATPPQGYGGTELVINLVTEQLVSTGHDVTLFATGDSVTAGSLDYVYEQGLYYKNIPWEAALPSLVHYDQAFSTANQGDFDIVHTHLSSPTDLMILPFLAKLRVPHVMTIHVPLPLDNFTHMDDIFLKHYGRQINVVNISQAMRQFTPAEFNSVSVVHNSVPINKLEFNPKGGKYLAWLGKIFPHKGLAEAIACAKLLKRQLVFAGPVEQQSQESVDYYKRFIEPHIDNKQIVYLGEADMKLKNDLLGNAEALLNPISWEEPFGLVMVEAQACGTPVIAFNRGAAPEVIKDGVSGFLVRTVEEMADAVQQLDTITRENCRLFVEQHFTPRVMALNYLQAYRQVINERTALAAKRILEPLDPRKWSKMSKSNFGKEAY